MDYNIRSAKEYAQHEVAKSQKYDEPFFDYHADRADDGAGLLHWGAIFCVLTVAVLTIGAVLYSFSNSGPNCPGMDPNYIGWCEQAQ